MKEANILYDCLFFLRACERLPLLALVTTYFVLCWYLRKNPLS
jgi:hypothetical protein